VYKIDNANAAGSLPTPGGVGPVPNGFFAQGVTNVDADWLNAVQEELADFIVNSPSAPSLSKTDRTQLRTALLDYLSDGKPILAKVTMDFGDIGAAPTGALTLSDNTNVTSATKATLAAGNSTVSVVFASALSITNYLVMFELIDQTGGTDVGNDASHPVTYTKTVNGFVFSLNDLSITSTQDLHIVITIIDPAKWI
jgi:hypothetical protein